MEKRVEPLVENTEISQIFGIVVAVFAVIITLVIFIFWQRRRSVGRSVLLTGLSDAGKTLLYARLIHSKFVETYLSSKENVGDITIKDQNLQIIDIPGHERLRNKFFDKYKSSARGLIFVIDSVTVQKDIRDVAEYLYTLLSDSSIESKLPILILCNKQDQTMAKTSKAIKAMLEKEINLVRVTKLKQLVDTDASVETTYLGAGEKNFEFSHLNNQVDFAECSLHCKESESEVNIEQLNNWLHKIV
ncbi:signal recognition particle receptor subunit beta [Chelonus insularis]|uniref:signal recognition particle receptor subunit beta n=1 Tax=Chelonus insularis TaxID=460826 RepID=UPI00158A9E0A|nr:signal recognition particle receptor subunit beta [Chelonus insularis]